MLPNLRKHLLIAFSFWIVIKVKCQLSDNTPPSMYLDRNWRIPDTEAVGSVITRVHGQDSESSVVEYGLEPLTHFGDTNSKPLPFRIDNTTGVVYLNESLAGRGGQNMFLYVTVSDGKLTAKTEVWVNIVNSSAPSSGTGNSAEKRQPPFPTNHQVSMLRPPNFLNLPSVFNRPPPPSISNNPPPLPSSLPTRKPSNIPNHPFFQQKTYPEASTVKTSAADNSSPNDEDPLQRAGNLLPPHLNVTKENDLGLNGNSISTSVSSSLPPIGEEEEFDENSILANRSPLPADSPVKTVPDLTVTVVPAVSVLAIFLAVAVIALVFRKKICMGRVKGTKDDMQKEPSGGIVLQEDPSITMQHWRGPRAFSNRYEPWETEHSHVQATAQDSIAKPNDFWEFPRHRLKVFNILGEGAFGQVWRCEAVDINGKEGVSVVAVKTLKENATEKERSDLLSELQVMKMLDPHPNVVRLLGCCTEKEPIFVIMEYISNGKLQSFLRNSRAERHYNNMHGQSKTLTSQDLTSFVYQVARGMEFLSSNGIIHRDLAARNILITEDHTCKVADFGFARDVITSHVYERKSEGRLPIRWMAPESLYDNIFSVKSDVWSFGVLIWEVVTLGSTPYPGLSAAEVMRKVRDGYRLEKPEHCRRELYNIMYYCWDKDPKQRPSFSECMELLEKLLLTETDYIELERFPDHSYYNMLSLSGEKL